MSAGNTSLSGLRAFRQGRHYHTSTSLWQLSQSQQGIVARNLLKGDVRVPQILCGLAVVIVDRLVAIRVELFGLFRRDDTDLIVLASVLPCCVVNWVNVQLGSFGLARQFP